MGAIGRLYSRQIKGGIILRLNLTLGECSVIYTALKAELRHLVELQSDKPWAIARIAEIEELIGKLDSL